MLYPDMRPFIETGSHPSGYVVDRIEEIFSRAGLTPLWSGPVPRPRILKDLARPDLVACLPNARLTPDRKGVFQYTDPLFPAPHWTIIFRRDDPRPARHHSLASLLADETLIFGHQQSMPLGPTLDPLLQDGRPNVQIIRGSPASVLEMLQAKRIDYAVADANSLDALEEKTPIQRSALAVHDVEDLGEDEPGRILCSLSVPVEVISRLNQAIAAIRERDTAIEPRKS
ncbi:substrate-binding periplasmic protein [Oleisolibacter albus]|uniref:substrate-binding periplasmic protein n=1 Tax=Oleisolibacter albus TaxID=2171757 RepID=UPI00139046FF|nr:transporter substrate-binding domain-containing protein [Oleisolibacter albus]